MHAGGLGMEPIHTLRSGGGRKASLELCQRLLSVRRLEIMILWAGMGLN